MNGTPDAGSMLRLYVVENGGVYLVDLSHWDEIDAAYGDWIERKRDRILCLSGINGGDIRIAASRISEFCNSTPETRARMRDIEAAEKAESGFAE